MSQELPPGKPDWSEAPDWAQSLGVCDWPCPYHGQWTWFVGTVDSYPTYPILFLEPRPSSVSQPESTKP